MRHEVIPLEVPAAVAVGAGKPCYHLEMAAVQFHGAGTLSFKLQGKISDPTPGSGDGSHDDWIDLETTAGTARIVQIPNGITHVRVSTTAFTSGTFSAHLGGKNSRTDC